MYFFAFVMLAFASIALGFAIGWVLRGRMAGLDEPQRSDRPPPLHRGEDGDRDVHP